jgi:hypothetical protein
MVEVLVRFSVLEATIAGRRENVDGAADLTVHIRTLFRFRRRNLTGALAFPPREQHPRVFF